MLDLIILLISELRAHDWRAALKTFIEIVSKLIGGETMPTIVISKPGETHPEDTTAAHTVTLS